MSNPEDLSALPDQPPDTITERMILALEQTRPHVWLVSVLGFFVTILMAIMIVLVLFAGVASPEMTRGGVGAGFVAFVYLVVGAIYFVPSLFLAQYGSLIGKIRKSDDRVPLIESALEVQRSFWRFIGVLTAVSVLIVLLLLGLTVFGNIFSSPSVD